MKERLFNLFGDNLTLITHCPFCNLRYNHLKARISEEGENTQLIYIQCQHCQSAILVLIVAGSLGITSIGLVTDLSSEDVLKFKAAKPINCDDVIKIYQFLNEEKVLIDYFD